jgi:hypothetical protein
MHGNLLFFFSQLVPFFVATQELSLFVSLYRSNDNKPERERERRKKEGTCNIIYFCRQFILTKSSECHQIA